MGTRCVTLVRQTNHGFGGDREEELFRFYRHWDGYPDGHGYQMALALAAMQERGGDFNNRNWAQHALAAVFSMDADLEPETSEVVHGDLDYLYVLHGEYAGCGGKESVDRLPVTIGVWRIGNDEAYGPALMKKPLFEGSPEGYVEWVEGGCES